MTDHYSSSTLTVNETKELVERDFAVCTRRERWLGRCLKIPYGSRYCSRSMNRQPYELQDNVRTGMSANVSNLFIS